MKNKLLSRGTAFLLALLLLLSTAGCSSDNADSNGQQDVGQSTGDQQDDTQNDAPATHVLTDAEGREVELPNPVTRAVVTNAYNTELIKAIGAIDRVVGVSNAIYADRELYSMFTDYHFIFCVCC